jgi:hypothetical protein
MFWWTQGWWWQWASWAWREATHGSATAPWARRAQKMVPWCSATVQTCSAVTWSWAGPRTRWTRTVSTRTLPTLIKPLH